ncbi:MAG: hypothetical protein JRJ44_01690 [Deltaproteobacteria bacterium]|nr:hypothetical protein [Deltaproteobacteria bacterium]
MKQKAEIQMADIVFIGSFNPAIFSPAWFASKKLIGETESEGSDVKVIHPDITMFELPWFRFYTTRDHFSVLSEQEVYFSSVFDLAVGTFQLLEHTPIQAMGINREFHIQCDSEKEWHDFGHLLAPQSPWEGILKKESALKKIEICEKYSPENPLDGKLTVIVQPSNRVRFGVFFSINDHYSIDAQEKASGSKKIISRLQKKWKESNEKSETIVSAIIDKFLKRS